MKNVSLKKVIKDTLPVMAGYLVIGMGFGIVMHANGYGIVWAVAMSLFVYAGSMQYAAVGLLTGGASLLTVALTTLAVNARHLFYGLSVAERYKGAGWRKPYMIFALTDETYSLVCDTDRDTDYCFRVSLLNHIYWVSGTVLGAILGNTVQINSKGVDFALTALFVTVFTDQWLNRKNRFAALTGVLASLLTLLLFGPGDFLIPAMGLITAVLLLKMKASPEEKGGDEN